MSLLTEYKTKKDELDEFLKVNGNALINEILTDAITYAPANIDAFLVTGYTPGFNDGEPCTHRTSVTAGDEMKDSIEYDEEMQLAIMGMSEEDVPEDEYVEDLFEDFEIQEVSYSDTSKIEHKITQFEELFEYVLGTNWQILVSRASTSIEIIFRDDYDCGY